MGEVAATRSVESRDSQTVSPVLVRSSLRPHASYHSTSEHDRRGRRSTGSRSSAERQSRLAQGYGAINAYEGKRCLDS